MKIICLNSYSDVRFGGGVRASVLGFSKNRTFLHYLRCTNSYEVVMWCNSYEIL